ncbi:hypothetical protein Y09_2319 [Brachybacterium sp. SW0106-09]|nr:hypothetical protein Y09_2319 [Brachybacterium sp. SW0106-09]
MTGHVYSWIGDAGDGCRRRGGRAAVDPRRSSVTTLTRAEAGASNSRDGGHRGARSLESRHSGFLQCRSERQSRVQVNVPVKLGKA